MIAVSLRTDRSPWIVCIEGHGLPSSLKPGAWVTLQTRPLCHTLSGGRCRRQRSPDRRTLGIPRARGLQMGSEEVRRRCELGRRQATWFAERHVVSPARGRFPMRASAPLVLRRRQGGARSRALKARTREGQDAIRQRLLLMRRSLQGKGHCVENIDSGGLFGRRGWAGENQEAHCRLLPLRNCNEARQSRGKTDDRLSQQSNVVRWRPV
jgi:hypothetical protein